MVIRLGFGCFRRAMFFRGYWMSKQELVYVVKLMKHNKKKKVICNK
ncbi:hypothetical protein KAX97_03420 [candidate division WOR-3 bacterium]|nr:hypothetical protein [candidate division WOR-3 bacterium]